MLANSDACVELEARRCRGQVGSASAHKPFKRVGRQSKLEARRCTPFKSVSEQSKLEARRRVTATNGADQGDSNKYPNENFEN